ncbi:HvfX family Cu-binding RiPP maturation protein [Pseudomonas sp. HK3]
MPKLYQLYQDVIQRLRLGSGIGPLLLRLYLAPIFMQAGYNKLAHFDSTVAWLGNPDWGLGLPFPELMAALAGGTELIGGALLIPGIAVRLLSIPLAATMFVAIFSVHWDNGWLAIADSSSWLANERVMDAAEQKTQVISLLKEHGNYSWLTQNGSITILNNGIEFAATYLIMLLSLLFTGAGRCTSIDHFIKCMADKRFNIR